MSSECIQAIVSISYERVPRHVREVFERAHGRAVVTRVIKETTSRGRVTFDVYFVDSSGRSNHITLPGAPTRPSTGAAVGAGVSIPRPPGDSFVKRTARRER
jgi:hypothetical protein